MCECLAAENIRRVKGTASLLQREEGAGLQQHSKMGWIRDWIADEDVYCFF
jgi:hypothetical protein